jgi:hypothetical protein
VLELIIDEERGLTALDLLSTTYKKAAELAGKSSKIALTFILVLTAFLGLNSLTGNESNTSLITTSSSQLSSNQDMPATVETQSAPVVKVVKPVTTKSISNDDLALHMQLAVDQLETTVLMLEVLDQADGGPAPTE